jgi:hypothetical protein
MTTPQITIHDVLTGETITRDFNAAEIAQAEADKIANDQADADATARAITRQAVLDKLGITAHEAQLLLG